jgi:hypothetical protein
MINWHDPISTWTAVGTIASVLGLGLSAWLIVIARGARAAARDAEQTVQIYTRKRGLVEELEVANHRADQLGALLQHEQWFAAQMRIQEIQSICSEILSRWADGLPEAKRSDLLRAAELARSVAKRLPAAGGSPPTESERGKLIDVQLRVNSHISSALGEARKLEERTRTQP